MKYLAAFVLLMLCGLSAKTIHAQANLTNDYVIVSTADVSDSAPYIAAMDAANWETYRLQNQRYQLAFDNGFTIELKSALELLNLGYSLNINNYQTSLPEGYVPPVLTLRGGNTIGMIIQPTPNTKFH